MKRIITTILCLLSFCFGIYAQSQNVEEMTEKQLNDSIRKWKRELGRFPKYIETQEKNISKNTQNAQKLKEELEEERSKYPADLLMAYDKQKVMEMEEYLKRPFTEISSPYVNYMKEKAERYPQDKEMSRMAKLIEDSMAIKSLLYEADRLNQRLLASNYRANKYKTLPFTYDEITNMIKRVQSRYSVKADKRLLDIGNQLLYYQFGIEYFKELVDAIQKTRVKKQDTQWAKDYKPLFDNLDKKESKNSSAKRIEYIKSLPYLEDCLDQLEKDLQERPYEESPIETLVLRIMGK